MCDSIKPPFFFGGFSRPTVHPLFFLCVLGVVFFSCVGLCLGQESIDSVASGVDLSQTKSTRSFIAHAYESAGLGWSMLMIVISISMVALSVFLLMELRLSAATPADLVEEFKKTVTSRQFQQAQTLVAENPSQLARALSAGLPKLQYGLDEAAEAASRKIEEFRAGKELIISFMAVIGQLGPLLGLVGTVYGMINSFQKLGTSSGNVDTKSLAGDISHALVVTLMGVGVAVPAIFFFTFFSKRLIQITLEINNTTMDMLALVYTAMRKGGAPPLAAPAVNSPTLPPSHGVR